MRNKIILYSLFSFLFCFFLSFILFMEIPRFKYEYDDYLNGYVITGFYGDKKEIDIPSFYKDKEVVKIGDNAFLDHDKIQKVNFAIDSNILSIGKGAFINCVNLKEIVLPNSLTIIEKTAFMGCSNLIEIDCFNNMNLKKIEGSAFIDCISLKNVYLPPNLNSIGDYAFYNSNIEEIKICSKTVLYPNALSGIKEDNIILY